MLSYTFIVLLPIPSDRPFPAMLPHSPPPRDLLSHDLKNLNRAPEVIVLSVLLTPRLPLRLRHLHPSRPCRAPETHGSLLSILCHVDMTMPFNRGRPIPLADDADILGITSCPNPALDNVHHLGLTGPPCIGGSFTSSTPSAQASVGYQYDERMGHFLLWGPVILEDHGPFSSFTKSEGKDRSDPTSRPRGEGQGRGQGPIPYRATQPISPSRRPAPPSR